MLCVVQSVVSELGVDNEKDSSDGDAKQPLLNPIVLSMLTLPLLQIVSLPQTAMENGEARDCQMTARHLLSVIHCYVIRCRHYHRHGDDATGALIVMPSTISHTCHAYVQLARHLSVDLHRDPVDVGNSGTDGVVNAWLQQVCSLLSADLQHSVLLTLLIASLFLLHDDATTVDSCLQLLQAISQSHKTQVIAIYSMCYLATNLLSAFFSSAIITATTTTTVTTMTATANAATTTTTTATTTTTMTTVTITTMTAAASVATTTTKSVSK